MSNPLHPLHQQAEAEFIDYDGTSVVLTFGEPQAEYAAIRKGAAMMDAPQRGFLELTGKDRHDFLNNLISNQVYDKAARKGLTEGSAVYSFLLNVKGRIVADLLVIEGHESTLLELDRRFVEPTRQVLEKHLFAEQVEIKPRLDAHQLVLTGPASLGVLRRVAEGSVEELPPMRSTRAWLMGHEVLVWRDDVCGVPTYTLLCPPLGVAAIWERFTDSSASPESDDWRFQGLARPVGWAAFNTTRIEAGRPLFGIDFDESVLPAETGLLDRAVSFTKGCYLGQEIVARMHARGQVARQIVGIRMEGDALPVAGTRICDDAGNEIGGVTSSTLSPVLSNAPLVLAILKKPYFAEGSTLKIPAEGDQRTGRVVKLPFI